jgi:hypothetical protein
MRRTLPLHCNGSFTPDNAVIPRPPKHARRNRIRSENPGRFAVFAEFVAALEGRRPEINPRNIDGFWTLFSEFGIEKLLSALDSFDALPLRSGVSSIEDESRWPVRDVEEKNLQFERDYRLEQQEVADLSGTNLRFASENGAQKHEKDALPKRPDELVARFAQKQSKSDDAMKRIMQELGTFRKQSQAPPRGKQFSFKNRREIPAGGGGIWQLMAKSGEANKRVLQECLRRRNSVTTEPIRELLGLASMRSMRSARAAAVFFEFVAKDPDLTQQKRHDYLTGGGSQPRKSDFARCSGIFRLRSGSSTSEDWLEVVVPDKHVFTPDGAHRIGVDFAGNCQGSLETFLRIKRLIEARYVGAAVGIRLDIGSGSIAIPTDSNHMLVLYSAAESLRIPDWIEIIHAEDFGFSPNLRQIIVGLQREIGGFHNCRKLERVELSRSVEVVGRSAFSADQDESDRGTERRRGCRPIFLMAGDGVWLRRRRRGCQIFLARKGSKKEENHQSALSGIISYLTAKCRGNVHDRGVVEITASSVCSTNSPQNASNLENQDLCFCSEDKPGQWICLDFKTLRIEPMHYTIRTYLIGHLMSWAVEGSNEGASWTEIDRHENNSDLNGWLYVKTFAVSWSGSFRMIRLRQTGPNHLGNNYLVLGAFELFGAVAGLQ